MLGVLLGAKRLASPYHYFFFEEVNYEKTSYYGFDAIVNDSPLYIVGPD